MTDVNKLVEMVENKEFKMDINAGVIKSQLEFLTNDEVTIEVFANHLKLKYHEMVLVDKPLNGVTIVPTEHGFKVTTDGIEVELTEYNSVTMSEEFERVY